MRKFDAAWREVPKVYFGVAEIAGRKVFIVCVVMLSSAHNTPSAPNCLPSCAQGATRRRFIEHCAALGRPPSLEKEPWRRRAPSNTEMCLVSDTQEHPSRCSARDGKELLHIPLPPPPTPRQDEPELWPAPRDECGQIGALLLPEHQTPQSLQELGGQSDGFSSDDDAIQLLGESLHDLESVSDNLSTEDECY